MLYADCEGLACAVGQFALKHLLYSRSFSSFFVRRDKILPFNYQAVTRIMKNNCKNTCIVLYKCLYLYNN